MSAGAAARLSGSLKGQARAAAQFERWLQHDDCGQNLWRREQEFFRRSAQPLERVLQLGQTHTDLIAHADTRFYAGMTPGADVVVDYRALPWPSSSLDGVTLAHGLAHCPDPAATLNEIHRVLTPHGRLTLTEFNPVSLWRLMAAFDGVTLPLAKHLISPKRVAQGAPGWRQAEGAFMVYTPFWSSPLWRARVDFLEAAGDRWWPHAAAVYGLVLVKRIAPLHTLPLDERVYCQGLLTPAAAVRS